MSRALPILLTTLAVSGCLRRQQNVDDPVLPLLDAADEAWRERDRVGLEAAEEPLQEAYGLASHRPDVLWRLVRLHHATGFTEPTDRARLFAWAEARSLGLDCLGAEPEIAAARQNRGWIEAIDLVQGDDEEACMAWTSLVWARWMAVMGTGAASVDLPVSRALAERSASLSDRQLAFLGSWATALLDATAPTWAGGDRTGALADFELLVQQRPTEVLLQVDRLRWTEPALTPGYRGELTEALRQAKPDSPEARAAQAAFFGTAPEGPPEGG